MELIYKVFITILSIILLLSTGLSLTICIADEIETNQYFASVTETVINSHYCPQVIDELVEEATEKDYELLIEVYGSTLPGSYKYAQVTLTYELHLYLFDIHLERVKQKIV